MSNTFIFPWEWFFGNKRIFYSEQLKNRKESSTKDFSVKHELNKITMVKKGIGDNISWHPKKPVHTKYNTKKDTIQSIVCSKKKTEEEFISRALSKIIFTPNFQGLAGSTLMLIIFLIIRRPYKLVNKFVDY